MDELLFPDEALAFLRETRYDPEARRGFEVLTCSFHWADERLSRVVRLCLNHESRAYFYLMVFRSSLIRGQPIEEYRRTWDQLRAACPDWPGFRPERSNPELGAALDRALRRQCIAFEREFRKTDKESDTASQGTVLPEGQ